MRAAVDHAQLVERGRRWLLRSRRCVVAFAEPVSFSVGEVPDVIGFTSRGLSVVLECKTSRADFLRDRRKLARRTGLGLGQERWYLTQREADVVRADDDLGGWGRLELRGDRVFQVVHPAPIERARRTETAEIAVLVSVLRRAELGTS